MANHWRGCRKCEEPSRRDRLEVTGGGCECLLCPACLKDARDTCRRCGCIAVFCSECDTGNRKGTKPLCPRCYKKKEEMPPPVGKKAMVIASKEKE